MPRRYADHEVSPGSAWLDDPSAPGYGTPQVVAQYVASHPYKPRRSIDEVLGISEEEAE